jgi:putative spermidine/putrescine transport system permease protein
MSSSPRSVSAWAQATPFTLVFALFLVLPLVLVAVVSTWHASDYELIPAFSAQNYIDVFKGCANTGELCVTLKTYLSTLKFCFLVWAITLLIGFAGRVLPRVPRALGRRPDAAVHPLHGAVLDQQRDPHDLVGAAARSQRIDQPGAARARADRLADRVAAVLELLGRARVRAPVHDVHDRADLQLDDAHRPRLIEAARDSGASGWQTVWNVVVPLCRTGIIIGSIFVITIVMGDFVTIGVMGGQQIASVGKIIQVQTSYLQFPMAAANAVILLIVTLMMIWGLTRLVDIRKEL